MAVRDYIFKLLDEADDVHEYLKQHKFEFIPNKHDSHAKDKSQPKNEEAKDVAKDEESKVDDLATQMEKLEIKNE